MCFHRHVVLYVENMLSIMVYFRVVLFEQLNETIYVTTSFLSLFISQKQWREKNKERE